MVNTPEHTGSTHFQGRDEREHLQFYFHQHWIRLVQPFFSTILWTLVILGSGYAILSGEQITLASNRHSILIALFSMFVIVQLNFLIRFYTYFLYVIVVTDRRLHRIKKTLISIDDHQTIDMWTLQDIHKSQHGLVQNIFGFGTLVLEANETMLRLHFVPRITRIHEKISRVREAAREKAMSSRQTGGV